ncbi:cysteine desulfurase [Shewanella cyperi]|uniref:cysteine desulfurase n=1 Tax=Shewanella cyperi TaxID=2814292 RepID=UPI001A945127|nr:cysteine desulfurase [Shewanella cyperi]QSX40008.1 cysteine desulfurase [Shewanella cyperi]
MDHESLRAQFPALQQQLGDYPLCYLDTAATSQKPLQVLEAMGSFYRTHNANVHRAAHALSSKATSAYEDVRDALVNFLGAARREEIIFTHGTTEAINLVAHGLRGQFNAGDLILVDSAAHHANLVPWQQLAKATGARVLPIGLDAKLRLDRAAFRALLAQKPKLVALSQVSNALGTVNDIRALCAEARTHGALTLVDGAQAVAHMPVNMAELGCDFYAFSGHKMYGPTGVGVLWGRYDLLAGLEPLLTGGEMIKTVSFEQTEFGELPNRLEAGTPPIAEVIGLGAAIEFLQGLDRAAMARHETELLRYLQRELAAIPGVRLYGAHSDNIGAVAFNLGDEHHQDIGILLDQQGVAVRCGHHCAMPLMVLLGVRGCCRASLGIYSNKADVDQFIQAMKACADMLQ